MDKEITGAQFEKARQILLNLPFARLIGLELVKMNIGEAVIKLRVRDELRQPHGLLHGGATATLIDTAMAFAVVSAIGENEQATTVDLNVHYLRPVTDGEIFCAAKVVKRGKRVMTISAEVFDESETLVATALSTYFRIS